MNAISYKHHHFPPAVIQQAVWLYYRVTLSLWDVEDLLAERGVEVSYETVRRWVPKFGPGIARSLRCLRPRAHPSRQFLSRSIPEAELAVSEGLFRTPDFRLRTRRWMSGYGY